MLALDTSTKISGWALYIDGKYIKSGRINFSDERNTGIRVKRMCLALAEVIKDNSPSLVVIEQMPSTRNANTTRLLSRVIGAVYFFCVSNGITYYEIPVYDWRGAVGIPNTSQVKSDSIDRVARVYNKIVDDNEADAINIGDGYYLLKDKPAKKKKKGRTNYYEY